MPAITVINDCRRMRKGRLRETWVFEENDLWCVRDHQLAYLPWVVLLFKLLWDPPSWCPSEKRWKACWLSCHGSQPQPFLGNIALVFAGVTFLLWGLSGQCRSLLTSYSGCGVWCSPSADPWFSFAFWTYYFFNHTEIVSCD